MSAKTSAAKPLVIGFEGYFACRIATDPDPTDEPRGMSGYTMALAKEDPLDQVIRLQIDEAYLARNARPPLREMFRDRGFLLGVRVWSVTYDGKPWTKAKGLHGAPVVLDGGDPPLTGPIFDSRNCISGNDDTMSFVVYPFNLTVGRGDGNPTLKTRENLKPPYEMTDPDEYKGRLSTVSVSGDKANEVSEAINVYDTYGYFRDRRRYLAKLIADAEADIREHRGDPAALEAAIQSYRSRIHQLEFWGDRVIGKLTTRCDWDFAITGPKTVAGDFGGRIDTAADWRTAFWFGGWDGDLLIGYMRGTLSAPFTPAA